MAFAVMKQAFDDPETVMVKIVNTKREAKALREKLSEKYDWKVTIEQTRAKTPTQYFAQEWTGNSPQKYWK